MSMILKRTSPVLTRLAKAASLAALACLVGCATVQAPNPMELGAVEMSVKEGPGEFMALQTLSRGAEVLPQRGVNYIRMEAVRDTAMSVGARTALAWRAEHINRMLHAKQDNLNTVFNFQALLMEGDVLPPVLLESRNDMSMEGPYNIRVADRSYRISKQARFVSLAPTWREYLIMDETRPDAPDHSLLPQTQEEKTAWQEGIILGWEHGLKQADMIYAENMARLKRDYQGMVRYRMLLAQNMISAPQVAHRDLGITGGGEALSVNDRILTIKALPSLKADSNTWTPSVAP